MNYALIFAGGIGERMKSNDLPKQLLKVHNKEIFIHTLEKFSKHPEIDGIVLVFNDKYLEEAKKLTKKFGVKKIIDIVSGGLTGQESIFLGLKAFEGKIKDSDIVLIHDGVRPLIDNELITNNINSVKKYNSAISASLATETVLISGSNNEISEIIDRRKSHYGRAPQSFFYKDILDSHKKALSENKTDFIDSASMMYHYGYELNFVPSSTDNIKITTIKDYYIFKAILDSRELKQFRIEDKEDE